MKRHVYRPPKARLTDAMAALGGIVAAIAVFVLVPLSQKLAELSGSAYTPPPEVTVEPPEDQSFDMDEPPEEQEPEPEPEENFDDAMDLDLGLEVADLSVGSGGFLLQNKFDFKDKAADIIGGAMDSPPTPVNRMPPQFPRSLLKKGVGGKVILTCVIDANGQMTSAKVKSSSGHSLLDQAALDAVRRWKFKPAMRQGKPFKATCNIPFNFQVKR